VLLRGLGARARVAHGCMTLPYGTASLAAEFSGLVRGLEAAAAAGARRVAVEGDSEQVIQQLLYRPPRSFQARGGASSAGAAALTGLFLRAAQLLAGFEHYELATLPRWGAGGRGRGSCALGKPNSGPGRARGAGGRGGVPPPFPPLPCPAPAAAGAPPAAAPGPPRSRPPRPPPRPPRSERNRAADRLANVALDLDAAMYGLLRLDLRGRDGIEVLLKAAGVYKLSVRGAAGEGGGGGGERRPL
jgi:hypothetical protein